MSRVFRPDVGKAIGPTEHSGVLRKTAVAGLWHCSCRLMPGTWVSVTPSCGDGCWAEDALPAKPESSQDFGQRSSSHWACSVRRGWPQWPCQGRGAGEGGCWGSFTLCWFLNKAMWKHSKWNSCIWSYDHLIYSYYQNYSIESGFFLCYKGLITFGSYLMWF